MSESASASETTTPAPSAGSAAYLYGYQPVILLETKDDVAYLVRLGPVEQHPVEDVRGDYTLPEPDEVAAKSDQERIAALEAQLAELQGGSASGSSATEPPA